MSSWGKIDAYTSAPLWALLQVNKAPTLVNMGPFDSVTTVKLFRNETAGDFITGVTVGLFNYSASEISSGHLSVDGVTLLQAKGAHQGWVLRKTGTGGRSGRVQAETLVAQTSNS